MTIRRGEQWGTTGPVPPGVVTVDSDAAAAAAVAAARDRGEPPPPLRLTGGDLFRTVGGRPGAPARADDDADHPILPVDLGLALLDGELHCFVAHVVARRSWWRGRVWVAMNAQFLGDWDVAPRSHPNDGRVDVLDVRLRVGERLRARRRLPSGTHVPHPRITEQRTAFAEVDLDPDVDVWLDGVNHGRARHLAVRVEPDALCCVL